MCGSAAKRMARAVYRRLWGVLSPVRHPGSSFTTRFMHLSTRAEAVDRGRDRPIRGPRDGCKGTGEDGKNGGVRAFIGLAAKLTSRDGQGGVKKG